MAYDEMILTIVWLSTFPISSGRLHSGNSINFSLSSCSSISASGKGYTFYSHSLSDERRISRHWHPSGLFSLAFMFLVEILTGAELTFIESLMLLFTFLSFFLISLLSFFSSSMGGLVFPWLEILSSLSCAQVANSSNVRGFIL